MPPGLGSSVNGHRGSAGANSIIGSNGNDFINGGAGNDAMTGGLGNDTLNGGLGQDSVNGGAGNDRITLLVTAGNVDTIDAGVRQRHAGPQWSRPWQPRGAGRSVLIDRPGGLDRRRG